MQNTEEPDDNRPPVSFSLPQILGGALAAVTVALVGSSLGTAGTVIGAAIASVVGAVAGTLYTAGFDRTGRSVGSALRRGWTKARGEVPADEVHQPVDPTAPVVVDTEASASGARRIWVRALASTAAILVVALAAIAGWELLSGQAFGNNTTRITDGSSARRASPRPSATPTVTVTTTATPTPSETPVITPTPSEPSPTVTEPTGTPTTSAPAPSSTAPTPETPTAAGTQDAE